MTDTTKPTPGPWVVLSRMDDAKEGVYTVIFDDENELRIARVYGKENSNFIAEAGNVFHETFLTPRQLLEQREELIAELQRVTDTLEAYMKDAGDQDCFEGTTGDARALIAKCGKVGV